MSISPITRVTFPAPRVSGERSLSARVDHPLGEGYSFKLIAFHSKDRKQYVASLIRLKATNEGTHSTERYQPFRDVIRITTLDVGRYSARGLEAFFTTAKDLTESLLEAPDEYPAIAALLTLPEGE